MTLSAMTKTGLLAAVICGAILSVPHAATPEQASQATTIACMAGGSGYVRARIAGAIESEIRWSNHGTTCTGEVRPNGGVRLSFRNEAEGQPLLIVFGIPGLQENRPARALPVNVTVVREGTGEFYSTQGDDKCTIDSIRQDPIKAAPHRKRSYRVIARGFCTEPARAVQGRGSVLLTRFDFAGPLHFDDGEAPE